MNRTTFICLSILFVFTPLLALSQIKASSSDEILNSIKTRKAHEETSLLKDYEVRCIGPVVMSGRITDIVVNPNNIKHFYVGFASAGIFETWNNGASFKPIFDNYGALGIGDLAISQSNPKILYAGTGENNSSRSSYAGSGIYRSDDSGQSWKHLGLTNTQHISKIIIHPTNPEIVWVASIGALYSENKERGVYKSTDGGKTWNQTLFVSESVGIIDLVIHPTDPKKLWASSWERNRKAWHFDGDGIGTAIYHSSDGGTTWAKSMNGLPGNEKNGRIGLAISKSNPDVLFAVMDNQEEFKEDEEEMDTTKIILKDLVEISVEDFSKLDSKKLDTLLKDKGFPKE
ncbi:MAG: glycosyl hydrolase, partial [Bacteroidia bacterium]|nr:glycosyl hydrolase [Bacteroidia bacterium]